MTKLKYEGKLWIQTNRFTNPLVASWGLGLGETEVISYALTHPEYITIIDDRAARNCALSLKVPVRGTLGVLLLAKMTGKINQVTPFIKQLQEAGLRINQKLRAEVIKLAKEDG